jgi:hypothetical protein
MRKTLLPPPPPPVELCTYTRSLRAKPCSCSIRILLLSAPCTSYPYNDVLHVPSALRYAEMPYYVSLWQHLLRFAWECVHSTALSCRVLRKYGILLYPTEWPTSHFLNDYLTSNKSKVRNHNSCKSFLVGGNISPNENSEVSSLRDTPQLTAQD